MFENKVFRIYLFNDVVSSSEDVPSTLGEKINQLTLHSMSAQSFFILKHIVMSSFRISAASQAQSI